MSILQAHLHLERLAYIGLGSIWFTDFVLAHKVLEVDDMISIEQHDIGSLQKLPLADKGIGPAGFAFSWI